MPCDNTKTNSEIENVDWSTGTGSGHHYTNARFGSGSSQASQSSGDICRICHCESDPQNPLLTPCYCAGSLKYVHQTCLQQWLTASETNSCELCKFPFIMHTKIKPFNEWRSLDISGIERRRLCCSVLFHCAAALCVIWSLCVLIERAADDVQRGLIDWPFWTKLAVVTVGLTGGVVFMYIQCKAYLHLCHRWKARNRILLIQNAPEKVHPLSPPSPVSKQRNRQGGVADSARISALNTSSRARESSANVSTALSTYNYATTASAASGNMEGNSAATLHMLPSSSHMLQQNDLDMGSVTPLSSAGAHHHHIHQALPQPQLGKVAVSANIECSQSQHNYERDWALDDVVSQISSFRPCPQGSGSLTPFHDSVHNVLENSEDSSRASVNDVCCGSRQDLSTGCVSTDMGRDHCTQLGSYSGSGEHRAACVHGSGVSHAAANGLGGFVYKPHIKRYSNSSIFLENRDILNDSVALSLESAGDFPRINYRHSTILTPPDDSDQLEKFLGRDLRRYSDTKLLGSDDTASDHLSLFNTYVDTVYSPIRTHVRTCRQQDTVLNMEAHLPTSPLSPPAAYAGQRQQPPTIRHSMHTVDVEERGKPHTANVSSAPQIDKGRLFFKSLPNLSSSCESLIKK